jgi:type II secretory ATPase GspE/PulE/Tfp pilus assembly ATPase PilB-like protein
MDKFSLKNLIDEEIKKPVDEISIVDLLQNLILYSYYLRASDLHLEPFDRYLRVRARIDGVMHTIFTLPKEIQDEIITRVKILANLRIDEHLAPQDGRFKYKIADEGKEFDIRVSIMPTYYGENCVMRLLVEPEREFTLENLGFSTRDLEIVKRAILKPYGMILVTGPTGSGKTTTLYTILKLLNSENVTIITLEDPIEYSIEGINQIQVNPQAGLTFDTGLRSILRQDPDIIMVGEIRDKETADISINAALTGHLLLSTLHTNDAATVFPRLLEMEVEPFLIASTVNVAIAQRLVRTICEECKDEKNLSETEIKGLEKFVPEEILEKLSQGRRTYYGKGCSVCNHTGYLGRIGIFEVLNVTNNIREAIIERKHSSEIKEIAKKEGMTTMVEDGFQKVLKGLTTVEEVLRVIYE